MGRIRITLRSLVRKESESRPLSITSWHIRLDSSWWTLIQERWPRQSKMMLVALSGVFARSETPRATLSVCFFLQALWSTTNSFDSRARKNYQRSTPKLRLQLEHLLMKDSEFFWMLRTTRLIQVPRKQVAKSGWK
jgi:hypothetical protein